MCNMKLRTCWRRNTVMLEAWEHTHIFRTRQTEASFSSFQCPEQPSLTITGERLEPRLGKFSLPWLIFFAPWFLNLWSFWTFKRKKLHGFQIWSTVVNNVLFYNPCVICCCFLCLCLCEKWISSQPMIKIPNQIKTFKTRVSIKRNGAAYLVVRHHKR